MLVYLEVISERVHILFPSWFYNRDYLVNMPIRKTFVCLQSVFVYYIDFD